MDNVLLLFTTQSVLKYVILLYAYLLNAKTCPGYLVSIGLIWYGYRLGVKHRRRINTDEMAKVVDAVWGTKLV